MRLSRALVDEIKQLVREKLFVAPAGERPRIATYAGRGHLSSLVRVVAVRTAISVLRRQRREHLVADPAPDMPSPRLDPELAHFQDRYQAHFKEAFEAAVQTLTSRERNLIRYQLVDGLSVDQIGSLYGTHRATAARWTAAARDKLAVATRQQLRARLALPDEEAEGLIRGVQSQIELSIQRLFADDRAEDEEGLGAGPDQLRPHPRR
jgi:RNA polymerase sigma-70 factor (ECF subfamily)